MYYVGKLPYCYLLIKFPQIIQLIHGKWLQFYFSFFDEANSVPYIGLACSGYVFVNIIKYEHRSIIEKRRVRFCHLNKCYTIVVFRCYIILKYFRRDV